MEQDDERAFHWFRAAAERGHVRAQSELGTRYENGRGGPQDFTLAALCDRKAADLGHEAARKRLEKL